MEWRAKVLEAIDAERDDGQEELPEYHNDKQYRVKTGLRLAFESLPPRPRVASEDIYSIQEIRKMFQEYFNLNRLSMENPQNPHILNFEKDLIGLSLVNKIYCRCQLGAVLKMLLIRPAM
jgi:hypothetical protein